MRPLIRSAADWLLPPKIERKLRRLVEHASVLRLRENEVLRNRHAGVQRCFVIGNGPSLKGMDLTPLAREHTIGANSFYKHPHAEAVGLNYLCIGDRAFMVDEPRAVEWHRTIARTLPRAALVLHRDARPLIERYGLYAGQRVFFFDRSHHHATFADEANLDFTRPLNLGMTTGTQLMIPLAMFLGYREIFLLGFDATWLEDTRKSYHFYDSHEFFPEFDSVAKDNRGISYEQELEDVRRDFEGHRLLNECARQRGVRIANATVGGLVDVYPRVRLEDVLSGRG